MNTTDIEQQSQKGAPLTDEPATHEFFAKHATKHGHTLQPGEYGYELQRAEKERADSASITERLQDSPTQEISQEDLHPSLRVPSTPLGYQFPQVGVTPETKRELEQFGGWMRSADVPRGDGNQLIQAAVAAARETPMSDVELRIAIDRLHGDLRRAWGKDYDANKAAVQQLIARVDAQHNGAVSAWLDQHPEVIASPAFVRSLARVAARKR
jgi:hypothetical protein